MPIEALVAVILAGVIGWWVFRAIFSAAERLKQVQHDPMASRGRRTGAVVILTVIFVLFVAIGTYLAIKQDDVTNRLQCEENYSGLCE
jgi:uncharacterized membrane protein SpoIIM required for sporulation